MRIGVGSGSRIVLATVLLPLLLHLGLLAPASALADGGKPTELFIPGKKGKLQAYLWRPVGA